MNPASQSIAIIIPCYNCSKHLSSVCKGIPDFIQAIYLVDDASTDNTADIGKSLAQQDPRVKFIAHAQNTGVGGATKTGMFQAYVDGHDVFVKMDGDGQMEPKHLQKLIHPILNQAKDYMKGNRFASPNTAIKMPRLRFWGNKALTWIMQILLYTRNIDDVTNGYIAISRGAFRRIDLKNIADDYFFEINLLYKVCQLGLAVGMVEMIAVYNNEKSYLSITKFFFKFPLKILFMLRS